jgi:hypothetical protein
MTIFEFNPPLQLCNDPNCKIVSLGEAAELLAAHVLAHADREAARFCDQIKHCTTPEVDSRIGSVTSVTFGRDINLKITGTLWPYHSFGRARYHR